MKERNLNENTSKGGKGMFVIMKDWGSIMNIIDLETLSHVSIDGNTMGKNHQKGGKV